MFFICFVFECSVLIFQIPDLIQILGLLPIRLAESFLQKRSYWSELFYFADGFPTAVFGVKRELARFGFMETKYTSDTSSYKSNFWWCRSFVSIKYCLGVSFVFITRIDILSLLFDTSYDTSHSRDEIHFHWLKSDTFYFFKSANSAT